ncbi:hypothetical protein FVB40_05720 [Raoultella ornithinolytica]|nr:hypothetical protein [Raoultella ornithinolytica]
MFFHFFSNEEVVGVAVITASTRKDNVALATARRARRKPNHPPGCTILLSVASVRCDTDA